MKLFRKNKDPLQQLEQILKGHEVPNFPKVTVQILNKVRDPEASMNEIADALRWDAALVVRVLGTVNSAAYGPAHEIQDVSHAASYLGRAQIEQMVLAVAVTDTLPRRPAPGFDAQRYWHAASRRASLSRLISGELHPARQAECFTVGLLQDMAVPVLAHARSQDYGPVLAQWHGEHGTSLDDIERGTLGWSHADVGGLLGRAWNLPTDLVRSITEHHDDGLSDHERLPAIRLVSLLRESEDERDVEALVEEGQAEYGLKPDWMIAAIRQANEQADELSQMLG